MEPVYEYVKGQGWVAVAERSLGFTTQFGRFRVVDRRPGPDDMFVSDPARDLAKVVKHCVSCNWRENMNKFANSRWDIETCVTIEYLGPNE